MSNDVILNNIEHQQLKVINNKQAQYGHDQMCCSLLISELRDAQRDYPIVFYKSKDDSRIYPMALFGFSDKENLFLTGEDWEAGYMQPAVMQKGPFKIGRQATSNGEENLVITVDLDDPRVNEEQGEALFLPHGGNAPYTQQIGEVLNRLASETDHTADFTQSLDELALLEPLTMEFKFNDTDGAKLTGFHMINEELLNNLQGDQLSELAKKGYLQSAYMCIASLSNISKLVAKKQS